MLKNIYTFLIAFLIISSLLSGCLNITPDITEETIVNSLQPSPVNIDKNGVFTKTDEVAAFIHIYNELPCNFITKQEALNLGWDSRKGNLWDVAYGKSIGGDVFSNYEGMLPEESDRIWYECDVNYNGGFRNGERIVYSGDGLIYYTADHYNSFIQLY
jgi:ribonuclease T1